MQVILLERIGKLGQMGDIVKVKDGYARNYLLPQEKALRATTANIAIFEKDRGLLGLNIVGCGAEGHFLLGGVLPGFDGCYRHDRTLTDSWQGKRGRCALRKVIPAMHRLEKIDQNKLDFSFVV